MENIAGYISKLATDQSVENTSKNVASNQKSLPINGGVINLTYNVKDWNEVLLALNEKPYSVKELDKIGKPIEDAFVKAITFLSEKYRELSKYLNFKNSNFKNAENNLLKNAKRRSLIYKISGKNISIEQILTKEIKDMHRDKFYFNDKKISYSSASAATRSGPGMLPYFSLGVDTIFIIKNLKESWENGKKIIQKLNLTKWGINPQDVILPSIDKIDSVSKILNKRALENSKNPKALKDLVICIKTIKAYLEDFMGVITNIMAFLVDLIDFIPGAGWLISLALIVPIIGLEWKSQDFISSKFDSILFEIENNVNFEIMMLNGFSI